MYILRDCKYKTEDNKKKKYYLLEIGSYNIRIVNVLLDYLF